MNIVRVLLALVLFAFAGTAWADRRVALVVGEDAYKTIRKLDNAVNDAQSVADLLEKLGFDVTLETNRDLKRVRRALDDFREDGAGADVALVYFAGHGVEILGDNRLLPTDADASSLEALQASTLPLEDVRAAVSEVAKTGLIILDACRSDPFGTSAEAGAAPDGAGRGAVAIAPDKPVKPGLGRVGRAEGVLFAFSAAPGETAADGADGHSPFAEALVKYLGTRGIEVRSTLTLVQQQVYDVSRGKQLPYVESGLPRLFFAAPDGGDLPERERLLLAMADVTPEIRVEVELIAARADMPLAPLYGALIGSDAASLAPAERGRKLQEAADAFVKVRAEMRSLSSSDPKVSELRQRAEQQLSLGAFDTARALLLEAADIDSQSRQSLKKNFVERTVSEATTHYLAGGASLADLRYRLAIEDYAKAAALYDEVEGFDLSDDDRHQHALVLELIGTAQLTLGNLTAAGDAYERMEALLARHVALKPGNLQWQRDLAVAMNKVGDVLYERGDLTAALAKYELARATLKKLVEADLGNVEWLRDLAVSFNRTGDLRLAMGEYQSALADYRIGLKTTEILVGIDPDNAGWRFDMAISHNKIGYALWYAGDLQAALASFDVSLSIDEVLAGRFPDNADYKRHTTINLNWIGDLKRLAGKPAEAVDPYRRSRAITEKLIERDPENTIYRRDLSVVLSKTGDASQALGDILGALELYRSSLAIAEYLAGLDPTNSDWQRDLSISHNRVGDLVLAQGNAQSAAAEYQAGFAIARQLLDAAPDNVQRILDVAYSRYKLAMAGVDRQANLMAARDAMAALAEAGRLPPAFESWQRMVDEALKAAPAP